MLLVTAVVDRLIVLGGMSLMGATRKRKVSAFASLVSNERLEDRALMSAVMETGASVAGEVSVAHAAAKSPLNGKYDVSSAFGDGSTNITVKGSKFNASAITV